ncbi:YchJ family metal-binding protein [Streptomyces sp. NPDC047002]|uniref:YchJ family protein n=1 Tax=Streptomyces sp. NPDC047002 TaxID=3155475 RepID=UPI0034512C83
MARPTRRPTTPAAPAAPAGPAPCPCGLPAPYDACCGPFHRGAAVPPTAEALMRSRYSAFAVRDEPYLLRTWAAATRPAALGLDAATRWTGLEITATTGGTAFHTRGTVAFRAHYTASGAPGVLGELSRFAREQGRWVYVDGTFSG